MRANNRERKQDVTHLQLPYRCVFYNSLNFRRRGTIYTNNLSLGYTVKIGF